VVQAYSDSWKVILLFCLGQFYFISVVVFIVEIKKREEKVDVRIIKGIHGFNAFCFVLF
jgi:hypothetical protein